MGFAIFAEFSIFMKSRDFYDLKEDRPPEGGFRAGDGAFFTRGVPGNDSFGGAGFGFACEGQNEDATAGKCRSPRVTSLPSTVKPLRPRSHVFSRAFLPDRS